MDVDFLNWFSKFVCVCFCRRLPERLRLCAHNDQRPSKCATKRAAPPGIEKRQLFPHEMASLPKVDHHWETAAALGLFDVFGFFLFSPRAERIFATQHRPKSSSQRRSHTRSYSFERLFFSRRISPSDGGDCTKFCLVIMLSGAVRGPRGYEEKVYFFKISTHSLRRFFWVTRPSHRTFSLARLWTGASLSNKFISKGKTKAVSALHYIGWHVWRRNRNR